MASNNHGNMIRGESSSSKGVKPIRINLGMARKEFKTHTTITRAQKNMLDNVLTYFCAGSKGFLCSELQNIASTFRSMNKLLKQNVLQIQNGFQNVLQNQNDFQNDFPEPSEKKVKSIIVSNVLTTASRNAMVEKIVETLPEEIQDKISFDLEQNSQELYRKILMEVIPSSFQHPEMIKVKGINPFHLKFRSKGSHPLSCFTEEVRKLLDWGMIDFLIINSATNLDFAPKCLSEILHRIVSEIRIQRVLIKVTSIPPEWACYDETNMFYRYLPAIHCFTVYPERKINDSYGYPYYELYEFEAEEKIIETLKNLDISKTLAYQRAHSIKEFQKKFADNSRCNADARFIYSSPHNFVFLAEGRWVDFQKRLKDVANGDIDMSEQCAHALSDIDNLDAYHNSFPYLEDDDDDFWNSLGDEGVHNLDNIMDA